MKRLIILLVVCLDMIAVDDAYAQRAKQTKKRARPKTTKVVKRKKAAPKKKSMKKRNKIRQLEAALYTLNTQNNGK